MAAFAITFMCVGIFTLMVSAAILRGWALSILWGWFAVPIFGLPALGVAQAIGIAMTVGLMTHQYIPAKDKDKWMPVVTMILTPFIALGIGWIVRRWL
jgi:hypothetical protein